MAHAEVPGVRTDEAGRCEKCGMTLEPSRVAWSCGLCKHHHEAT